MKLNHTNLPVTDVDAAREFLEQYFEFQYLGGQGNVVVLSGEDEFVLALTPSDATVPSNFHIGFFVDREETVDDLHHRLKEDGFDVGTLTRRHTVYDFYVEAPGGFTIEVGT